MGIFQTLVAISGTLDVFGACIGAGIIAVGAAKGIGMLAAKAVEGMARQPEAAGKIQVAMIISAALIEGFTFFALIVCLIKGGITPGA